MKPIIGYARVSTEEQANTHALEQQKSRLINAGVQKIYFDIESGREQDRDQFKKVLDLVIKQEVSEVRAIRWDRLVRNPHLYLEVKKIFQASGVKLRLLDQGEVDFNTASGELHSDLQVLFSVHESRMLQERVNRGFDYRRSRNAAWTRPPWGYLIVNEKYELDRTPLPYCFLIHRPDNATELSHEPDDSPKLVRISRAKIAREVFEYFLQVRKPTKVLKYLHEVYGLQKNSENNLPEFKNFPISIWGLKYWLQNPVFQGHTAYHKLKSNRSFKSPDEWDIRRDTHPEQRLINESEAQEIQAIFASNTKRFGQVDAKFYLTGHIFCEKCRAKCNLKQNRDYAYYGCPHSATVCDNRKNVRLFKIEQAIIAQLVLRSQQVSESPSNTTKSEKLVELERQYFELDQIAGSDFNPALKEAKEKLLKAIEAEATQTQDIAQQILRHPMATKINFWYTLTQKDREIFYDLLLARVVIGEGEVTSVLLKV